MIEQPLDSWGSHLGTYHLSSGGGNANRVLQLGCLSVGLGLIALAAVTYLTNRSMGWHYILGGFAVIALAWATWSWVDQKKRDTTTLRIYESGLNYSRGSDVRSIAWEDVDDLRPQRAPVGTVNPLLGTIRDPAGEKVPARWILYPTGQDGIVLDLRHWRQPFDMMRAITDRLETRGEE